SENENRKEFTYSERMDWSKRLGRIESIKARERQGKRTDLTSDKTLSDVRADDVVAEKSGFGSREQYRKAKFIDEHADEETIKKLDEEKISIHRAWTETKEKLEQAEKRAKQAESQAEIERKERERLERENEELANVEPERIEVVPDDYDLYKGNYESAVNLQKRYKDQMEEMRNKLNSVHDELKQERYKITDDEAEEKEKQVKIMMLDASKSVLQTKLDIDEFMQKVAVTSYRRGAIAASSDSAKKKIREGIDDLKNFISEMEMALDGTIEQGY